MKNGLETTMTVLTALGLCLVGCTNTGGAGGSTVGSGPGTGVGPGAGGSTAANMMAGPGGSTAQMGAGGSTATGGRGGNGGNGMGGAGGMGACTDQGPGEANETMATATLLAGGSDCPVLTVAGTLDGPNDVDWYKYVQTDDELGCSVNPTRKWSQQAGNTMRVCKYLACADNEQQSPDTVDCNNGSTSDTQGGLDGCCGTTDFDIGVGLFTTSCTDDLLTVYLRIDEPGAPADTCNGYNMNYEF